MWSLEDPYAPFIPKKLSKVSPPWTLRVLGPPKGGGGLTRRYGRFLPDIRLDTFSKVFRMKGGCFS